ncbi:hypothetical protein CFREI_08995 [Corynebacterium freiburgense]|nr:hypothetical protein CFREI_08995 [Corynebacterium freiburgense]
MWEEYRESLFAIDNMERDFRDKERALVRHCQKQTENQMTRIREISAEFQELEKKIVAINAELDVVRKYFPEGYTAQPSEFFDRSATIEEVKHDIEELLGWSREAGKQAQALSALYRHEQTKVTSGKSSDPRVAIAKNNSSARYIALSALVVFLLCVFYFF